MPSDDRVLCASPTPGKRGTRIPRWKFEAVRKAILAVVPGTAGGVPFRDLPSLVRRALPPDARRAVGSIPWHVTTVKLHLETTGEIERVGGAVPQRLRRRARARGSNAGAER